VLSLLLLVSCGTAASGDWLTRSVPSRVARVYREAAREVQIPVTCPRLVPVSRYVAQAGLFGVAFASPHLWELTFNNGDNGPGYVHWIVGSGMLGDIRFYVLGDEQNVVRSLPKRRALKRVGGRMLVDYRFPAYPAGGPHGGHAAAFVSCGGRYVFASVHGRERQEAAERIALDLADQADCPRDAEPQPTMPAPAGVAYACDRIGKVAARRHVRWRVVCPPVVPWSREPTVDYAGGVTTSTDVRSGYLVDGTSPRGHWTFASGDPATVHRWIERAGRATLTHATMLGQRVAVYRLGPGTTQLSGRVAIEWTFRGQAFQVSVHRRAGGRQGLVEARAMAAALIGYLRHAEPSAERPQRPR
jgi:hypothetical protein